MSKPADRGQQGHTATGRPLHGVNISMLRIVRRRFSAERAATVFRRLTTTQPVMLILQHSTSNEGTVWCATLGLSAHQQVLNSPNGQHWRSYSHTYTRGTHTSYAPHTQAKWDEKNTYIYIYTAVRVATASAEPLSGDFPMYDCLVSI